MFCRGATFLGSILLVQLWADHGKCLRAVVHVIAQVVQVACGVGPISCMACAVRCINTLRQRGSGKEWRKIFNFFFFHFLVECEP